MFARLCRPKGIIAFMLAGCLSGLFAPQPARAAAPAATPPAAVSIAAGDSDGGVSLALRPDGSIWGWGTNDRGALGDGTLASTFKPARLTDLQGITAVAAGAQHMLGLKSDGTVLSWGANESGQLGSGSALYGSNTPPDDSWPVPTPVASLSGVQQVAAAGKHSLALKTDGTLWAWGYGAFGIRGTGYAESVFWPEQVPGLPPLKFVSTSMCHVVAAATDGSVWQWGNDCNVLSQPVTPHRVAGMTDVKMVAAGEHFALALRTDGTVWAWGQDDQGQLGNGPAGSSVGPGLVLNLSDVSVIAAGPDFAFARLADGSLRAWGHNDHNQLGDGSRTNAQTPVAVRGLANVAAVAANRHHAVAMTADGELWTWGEGALGDGQGRSTHSYPYHVPLPQGNVAPTWPAGSTISVAAGVHWTQATHPAGVYRYRIVVDGAPAATAPGSATAAVVKGLRPGQSYTFTVQAQDAAGNWSADGPSGTGISRAGLLAAGGAVSAVVRPDGTVLAWGTNNQGQVGVGHTFSPAPVVRTRTVSDAALVTTNGSRTLALRRDGSLWEWGARSASDPAVTEPVPVAGLTEVVSIGAGADGAAAFAVKSDGTVREWSDIGAAGGPTPTLRAGTRMAAVASGGFATLGLTEDGRLFSWQPGEEPLVSRLTGVVTMAVSEHHALAVRADGSVTQWGNWPYFSPEETTMFGLSGVTMVAAGGKHSLALKADGTVWAWGTGEDGQLGDGTRYNWASPVKVSGLSNVIAIAAGWAHSLAMTADGAVWAWGQNDRGQLGDGTTANRFTPVQVALAVDEQAPAWPGGSQLAFSHVGPTSFMATWTPATDNRGVVTYRVLVNDVPAGDTTQRGLTVRGLDFDHPYNVAVAAMDSQGNWSAQLREAVATTQVAPETLVSQISAGGDDTSVAVKDDGVWIWGNDPGWGQAPGPVWELPVRITEPDGLVDVATGDLHMVALHADGRVWTWGVGPAGELGNGMPDGNATRQPPAPVDGLSDVIQVSADSRYSVALKKDGTVWTWGANYWGELGIGTKQSQGRPVQVPGLNQVVAVASSGIRTLALKRDGTVWSWGYNEFGQVGDGSFQDRLLPVQVKNLTEITAIAASPGHSLALKTDGTVWAWGANTSGQLGQTTQSNEATPLQVPGLSGVTALAAGASHSLALRQDGSVMAWGANDHGQLGDGTYVNRVTPTVIPGFTAKAVAAGAFHSLAIRSDNTAWSWGWNRNGVLGVDYASDAAQPTYVKLPPLDRAAPDWHGETLTATNRERTSVALAWGVPQDENGVIAYRLYQDGKLVATLPRGVTSFAVTGLKPATGYRFQVEARDSWGNWSTDGPRLKLVTASDDTAPPELRSTNDGKPALYLGIMSQSGEEFFWTRPKSVTSEKLTYAARTAPGYAFSGVMNEPLSQVVVNGKQIDGAVTRAEFTVPAPMSAGKSATFTIEVFDMAGNKAVLPSVLVQPDDLPPTVAVSSPQQRQWPSNGLATLTGTASEELLDVLIWSDELRDFLSPESVSLKGQEFAVTVPVTGETLRQGDTYHLRVVGVDYALNGSQPDAQGRDSRTFVIDTVSPAAPVVTAPDFPGGTLTVARKQVTLTGQAEANAVVKGIAVKEGTGGTPAAAQADANGAFTLTVPLEREGISTLRVWAEDLAGNGSAPVVYTVNRDAAAPQRESLTLRVRYGAGWTTLDPVWVPGAYTFSLTGAEEYLLEGAFGEQLGAVTVNGKDAGVTLSGNQFAAGLTQMSNGRNAVHLVVSDELGNADDIAVIINVDNAQLAVSVAEPGGNLLLAAADGRSEVTRVFAGTATRELRELRVVAADGTGPLLLDTSVQIDPQNPKKWTARVTVPTDAPAQWSLRFEGQDLAGTWSTPDRNGKDRRMITVDPVSPTLTLRQALPDVIYTNGKNGGVVNGTLTISGTASDTSGIKRVVIGQRTLTPPKGREKQFSFTEAVRLQDGGFTKLDMYVEDIAGNRSEVDTIWVISRSKISKLSVAAKWSRTAQTLTISGATDPAVKLNDRFVAVVPLTVNVKDARGRVVEQVMLDEASAGYDFARGTFTVSLNNPSGLTSGGYTVEVTAGAPAEMPWLTEKRTSVPVVVD